MSVPEQQKGKVEVKPVPPPVSVPAPQQATRLQARIDTAYTTDWTPEEQVALDATLDRFPAMRHPPLERYVRAAAALPKKNVRDVALRVIWLASSANKRRAQDENAAKKRPRIQSIFAVQPKGAAPMGLPPNTGYTAATQAGLPGVSEHGSGGAGAAGGPMAHLLEQNYLILNQYKQNMQQYKVHENTELLVRFRDNILTILGQMSCMTGLMQHMPPLPVNLNQELANSFLPKPGSNMYGPTAQPAHTAAPGGFRLASDVPSQMQTTMSVAPVVPVSSAPQANASSKSQDTKASSSRSKPKAGLKRGPSVKLEEKAEEKPRPDHLRSSARRAAQKATPAKSENTRSSARIAAASDSGQS